VTATDSLYRRFGALQVPLAAIPGSQAGALAALDPARDILLDLFAAALKSELTPVWDSATIGTPLEGSEPVTTKLPGMPTAEALGEMKTGWPMLCVARSPQAVQFGDYTLELRMVTQRWDVDYILCPLALANLLRVQDVLPTIGKIVDMVLYNRGHRAYRTMQNGNAIFAANVTGDGENCCGFVQCRVVDMALGPASFSQGGPKYYACGLTLESVEVSNFLTDANGDPDDGEAVPLQGATGNFGLTESGDPSIVARG
jgi:hypothetical protein